MWFIALAITNNFSEYIVCYCIGVRAHVENLPHTSNVAANKCGFLCNSYGIIGSNIGNIFKPTHYYLEKFIIFYLQNAQKQWISMRVSSNLISCSDSAISSRLLLFMLLELNSSDDSKFEFSSSAINVGNLVQQKVPHQYSSFSFHLDFLESLDVR